MKIKSLRRISTHFTATRGTPSTSDSRAIMQDQDEIHCTYSTPAVKALSPSSVSYGYGFQIAFVDNTAPDLVANVACTDPGWRFASTRRR